MRPSKTQVGTRDLPRFLDNLASRAGHLPRKMRHQFAQGPGGSAFRNLDRKPTKKEVA